MHDQLELSTTMPVPAEELFAWHSRPGAFERLQPPWDRARVVRSDGVLRNGSRVVLRVPFGPFGIEWTAEHRDVEPGRGFTDVQVAGPFAAFEHRHGTERDAGDPQTSVLRDHLRWRLPLGAAGRLLGGRAVRGRLARAFAWRHETTRDDLMRHRAAGVPPMKILVTGASGLLGSALVPFLTTGGHTVVRAVRRDPGPGEVRWEPHGRTDPAALAGIDAVVHLAGENVGQRWSARVKDAIVRSRVDGTRSLAEAIAAANPRPATFVCASAVGWYGDTGDRTVDESAPRGTGFLADVAEAWEGAADPARAAGVRTVHLRFGVLLSPAGGALARMLTPFKLGAGGVIGSGEQGFPWVSIDDAVGAVHHALTTPTLSGPVNCVGPETATNRVFTKALGRVLGRPTIFPMPGFVASLAFGEMGREMLLAGQRVRPAVLERTGYRFRHTTLESALRGVLGR